MLKDTYMSWAYFPYVCWQAAGVPVTKVTLKPVTKVTSYFPLPAARKTTFSRVITRFFAHFGGSKSAVTKVTWITFKNEVLHRGHRG